MERPTGTSTYALNLLPYLQILEPTLLTAQPIPPHKCHPIPPGQTPEQGIKGHARRLMWTQWRLSQIYRSLSTQLLFSPIPEAPLYADCRYVVTVHDLIPLRFPKRFSPLTPYFRYYLPWVLAQAEHILCNSVATATDLINFYQIPSAKITPILLAHNANHFQFLDLPTQNYFLYIGRHDPYKNLSRLIAAFAKLAGKDNYELWIAGPVDKRYTPSLQAQVNHLALNHRVKFLDYVSYDQLPRLINQAIALLLPSLWEGFGFPVLDAMACGTPVITANLSS
ncbi:MAG: glycosyltransferase family 4 protein, partial [Cyanothece sp. SIO1E1]|nr:glycosyltransferase family 4 protein [Cyanothece sp. SIO1E1]